jgi:hypothetical protein
MAKWIVMSTGIVNADTKEDAIKLSKDLIVKHACIGEVIVHRKCDICGHNMVYDDGDDVYYCTRVQCSMYCVEFK